MFEYRLAAHLRMTVSRLRLECSSLEYGYWKAYEEIYGFPDERIQATVAISGSAVANCWRKTAIEPHQLLPFYVKPKLNQSLGIKAFQIFIDGLPQVPAK